MEDDANPADEGEAGEKDGGVQMAAGTGEPVQGERSEAKQKGERVFVEKQVFVEDRGRVARKDEGDGKGEGQGNGEPFKQREKAKNESEADSEVYSGEGGGGVFRKNFKDQTEEQIVERNRL